MKQEKNKSSFLVWVYEEIFTDKIDVWAPHHSGHGEVYPKFDSSFL